MDAMISHQAGNTIQLSLNNRLNIDWSTTRHSPRDKGNSTVFRGINSDLPGNLSFVMKSYYFYHKKCLQFSGLTTPFEAPLNNIIKAQV